MKSLLFVSLCLVLMGCSCASSLTRGGGRGETVSVAKEQLPPMIDASGSLCKYNMTVDFLRKHFSGLLLLKETGTGTYRALFSTHFGLSLFDLEVGADSLRVHHCVEPLNKRKILNLFYRDFQVLLGLNLEAENKATRFTGERPGTDLVYQLSISGQKCYYRMNNRTGHIQEIRQGSGLRKITFCSLPDSTGQESIRVTHTGLKLSIGLDAIH